MRYNLRSRVRKDQPPGDQAPPSQGGGSGSGGLPDRATQLPGHLRRRSATLRRSVSPGPSALTKRKSAEVVSASGSSKPVSPTSSNAPTSSHSQSCNSEQKLAQQGHPSSSKDQPPGDQAPPSQGGGSGSGGSPDRATQLPGHLRRRSATLRRSVSPGPSALTKRKSAEVVSASGSSKPVSPTLSNAPTSSHSQSCNSEQKLAQQGHPSSSKALDPQRTPGTVGSVAKAANHGTQEQDSALVHEGAHGTLAENEDLVDEDLEMPELEDVPLAVDEDLKMPELEDADPVVPKNQFDTILNMEYINDQLFQTTYAPFRAREIANIGASLTNTSSEVEAKILESFHKKTAGEAKEILVKFKSELSSLGEKMRVITDDAREKCRKVVGLTPATEAIKTSLMGCAVNYSVNKIVLVLSMAIWVVLATIWIISSYQDGMNMLNSRVFKIFQEAEELMKRDHFERGVQFESTDLGALRKEFEAACRSFGESIDDCYKDLKTIVWNHMVAMLPTLFVLVASSHLFGK